MSQDKNKKYENTLDMLFAMSEEERHEVMREVAISLHKEQREKSDK